MTDTDQEPTARTIDCTAYDYAYRPIDNGQRGHIACWTVPSGGKPHPGDWLLLRNGNRSSRYRVETVDRCFNVDPPTMWMANVMFDPRLVDATQDRSR